MERVGRFAQNPVCGTTQYIVLHAQGNTTYCGIPRLHGNTSGETD
jgi:hypothetical protein